MKSRIFALFVFLILMIPLLREQADPLLERNRQTLLFLIGVVGLMMLVNRFVRGTIYGP